ncbi:MAG: hypothetical protein CVV42_17890 [Candidatus Riflebacteria bacterium HGW-Riflebacteria-2]|jgi:hypothetical protein|nr:MAG: hypothetical protein CVV42_17890 [Candidatus Riflebacteria bacterium HGW-Riflebacteria-2]
MPAMLKSKKFWGIILSFFFLWLALQKVDWKHVPAILGSLKFEYLFLIFISYTLEHLIRAVRWRQILIGREFPFKTAYFGIVIGYFFNNILPARAGEFFRAYYLKKKKVSTGSEAFGSVVFERFLDGVVIVSLLVFSLQNFKTTPLIEKASISAIVFYCLVLVGIMLLQFKRSLFVKISTAVFSLLPEKLSEKLCSSRDSFIDGLGLISQPVVFIKALITSFIAWGISLGTLWLSLQMFSIDFGFNQSALLISVLAIGSMIPSSPGMIGIYQFCCVITLNGIFGLSHEIAATFGLVCHFIAYSYVLVLGFAMLTHEGMRVEEVSTAENQDKENQESVIS